jgi:uncharacterized protein (TIGR02996 family)
MDSAMKDLSSGDASVVFRALRALLTQTVDDETLGEIAMLLGDGRVHTENSSIGPMYTAVCEAAIDALVAAGPRALPLLERARSLEHRVTVPEPAYDQGVYIGDYTNRTVVIAETALEGIRRIGRAHHESVSWVGMTRKAWEHCREPETMLKAVFEQRNTNLPDHVRRFLVACCRDVPSSDPELHAAMAIAEQVAFTSVTRDALTAARASVRYPPSPVARTMELALASDLELAAALEALALVRSFAKSDVTKRLRELVPYQGAQVEAPKAAAHAASWEPLLAAVLENLDDDAPRLAFAHWLSRRGDPRGELITVQCAIARDPPGSDAMRARERELLVHTRAWTRWPDAVIFERGFAERALTNTSFTNETIPALRGEPTLRAIKVIGVVSSGWTGALAKVPEARRLRRLTMMGSRLSSFEIDPLLASRLFDDLRELELSSCGIDVAMLDRLIEWTGVRRVERLVLTGNALPADTRQKLEGSPWLPALRELVL